MSSLFRPVAIAVALLTLAPVAAACFATDAHGDHGDCSGDIIEVGPGVYYVITGDTPDQGWGYLEANGETGLQRGGCPPFWLRGSFDPCQQSDNPDLRWY